MEFMLPVQLLSFGQDSPRSPAGRMFMSICRKVAMARPKQFLKSISKVFASKKRDGGDGIKAYDQTVEEGDDWGKDGVWQREILMGHKCQPLDYAGVIYYNSSGKQVSEAPFRSPRLSPLPGYLIK